MRGPDSQALLWLGLALTTRAQQGSDTLGVSNGFASYQTGNFLVELVNSSQTLASLVPATHTDFDFLPRKPLLAQRAADGMHQLGDVVLRSRYPGQSRWIKQDSADARHSVTNIPQSAPDVFASANLAPTLSNSSCKPSIEVLRTWGTRDGDLTLSFQLRNTRTVPLEIGGLGFPMVSDSIFTKRKAVDINQNCSLIDPNIGLNGGYLRYTRLNGQGPALVVTPLNQDSGMEGWGFLHENTSSEYEQLDYQTETFEGYYQYMPLTLAYAEEEWNISQPWNEPTSKVLLPGQNLTVGFRFSLAETIEAIEDVVSGLGVPVAKSLPGYILSEDLGGQLTLQGGPEVNGISSEPSAALQISKTPDNRWKLTPQSDYVGRVRLTIKYEDGRKQSVHYYATKSGPQAVYDAGKFLEERHWWTNTSDPFGRAPSFMCVDHSDGVGSLVIQDYLARVWLSGECHEAGASWYTMALKQLAQPDTEQVAKLEWFVDDVLWKTIQLPTYAVPQSIFWYDPNITNYVYNPDYPWWPDTKRNYSVSWSHDRASSTGRPYGYTYPATTYWTMYRVGRAFPSMLQRHSWEWYLTQAYKTVVYCFQEVNGTHLQPLWHDGMMGETVYGELLKDLYREGWDSEAKEVEGVMKLRADWWETTATPFGSELGWDCTGQEGVFYWANYFGNVATVNKTIETILGFMPVVSHWAYHGNARRYWDFQFGGKIDRIERQIHHYGSALNALPLLGYLRAFPEAASDYLVRLAYGGLSAPLSNIHADGFASAAFHSWPETLAWDNYTGEYGLSFAGLVLGSATWVRDSSTAGDIEVFGGLWEYKGDSKDSYTVLPRDALRRRLYIEPMRLYVDLETGAISSALIDRASKTVTLQISQSPLPGTASANETVIWLNQNFFVNTTDSSFNVSGQGVFSKRAGWAVPLVQEATEVRIQLL